MRPLLLSLFLFVLSCPAFSAPSLVDVTDKPHEGFLCPEARNPEKVQEKRYLQCSLATAQFAPPNQPSYSGQLLVLTYNAERGIHLEEQIPALRQHPQLSRAGLLLVTELDRNCSRSGNRDTARDLAKALGMNMVFGVQFVELPRPHKDPDTRVEATCEHGQAILSPWPITQVLAYRHRGVPDPWIPPGPKRENREPRLGGVLVVLGTISPGGKPIRAAMVHLDVGQGLDALRHSEADEILALLKNETGPIVAAGDFNTIPYKYQLRASNITEPVVRAFKEAGFTDAHSHLPVKDRPTTTNRYFERFVLDLIWIRNAQATAAGVGEMAKFGTLSDHLPVWADLRILP